MQHMLSEHFSDVNASFHEKTAESTPISLNLAQIHRKKKKKKKNHLVKARTFRLPCGFHYASVLFE